MPLERQDPYGGAPFLRSSHVDAYASHGYLSRGFSIRGALHSDLRIPQVWHNPIISVKSLRPVLRTSYARATRIRSSGT